MAYCIYCGRELRQDAKFCDVCGKKVGEAEDNNREVKDEKLISICPNCGAKIEGFQLKCKYCGTVLKEIPGETGVNELFKKLEQIDIRTREQIEKVNTSSDNRLKQNIREEKVREIEQRSHEEKKSTISNYPIPNTRKDLYEFMIMAYSNIDTDAMNTSSYENDIIDAWVHKFEQAYEKANLLIGTDSKIDELYGKFQDKIHKREESNRHVAIVAVALIIGLLLLFVVMIVFMK